MKLVNIRVSLESLLCSAFWSHLQTDKGLELSPVINFCPSSQRGWGTHLQIFLWLLGKGWRTESFSTYTLILNDIQEKNNLMPEWHILWQHSATFSSSSSRLIGQFQQLYCDDDLLGFRKQTLISFSMTYMTYAQNSPSQASTVHEP